jgi:hypothetical protein
MKYALAFNYLATFLRTYYPRLTSIVDIPIEKALLQWRSFLLENGKRIEYNCSDGEIDPTRYASCLSLLYAFFVTLYDTREEYEKDVWDCRKILGAKITETGASYLLNFTDIPFAFGTAPLTGEGT